MTSNVHSHSGCHSATKGDTVLHQAPAAEGPVPLTHRQAVRKTRAEQWSSSSGPDRVYSGLLQKEKGTSIQDQAQFQIQQRQVGNLGSGSEWVDGKLLTETSGAGGF